MKKTLFGLLIVMTMFNAIGSEIKTYTCKDIYNTIDTNKTTHKIDLQNANVDKGSALGGMFVGGLLLSTNPITASLIAVGGLAYGIYLGGDDSREGRVLDMVIDEANTRMDRILLKAQEKKTDVTRSDIIRIVEKGFSSGVFCDELPKTWSPRKVRSYIISKL